MPSIAQAMNKELASEPMSSADTLQDVSAGGVAAAGGKQSN